MGCTELDTALRYWVYACTAVVFAGGVVWIAAIATRWFDKLSNRGKTP